MYIYIYIHIFVCIHTNHLHVYIVICTHNHVYMYIYIYVCIKWAICAKWPRSVLPSPLYVWRQACVDDGFAQQKTRWVWIISGVAPWKAGSINNSMEEWPQYTTMYHIVPTIYHNVPLYITAYHNIPQYTTIKWWHRHLGGCFTNKCAEKTSKSRSEFCHQKKSSWESSKMYPLVNKHSYGKSLCSMEKLTINGDFL